MAARFRQASHTARPAARRSQRGLFVHRAGIVTPGPGGLRVPGSNASERSGHSHGSGALTITIHDVAREAGVSIKTVSRVLNREPNVRPAMRTRVEEVIARLNYRPNISARSLAGARSYLIGLIYDDPSPSYLSELQIGATGFCQKAGYHLMTEHVSVQAPGLRAQVESLISAVRLDGVILSPPVSDSDEAMAALEAAHIRYVRIAPSNFPERASSVLIDDRTAAEEMTRALWQMGHRDIAFVKGPRTHPSSRLRLDGFLAALKELGGKVRKDWILPGTFNAQSGFAAGEVLFRQAERPTAVFASNDDMAVGLMNAAHRWHIEIPAELSVVGFDDSPIAATLWPALTTVRQPTRAMAEAAVQMLIEELRDPEQAKAPRRRLLDFQIVRRESTALVGTAPSKDR